MVCFFDDLENSVFQPDIGKPPLPSVSPHDEHHFCFQSFGGMDGFILHPDAFISKFEEIGRIHFTSSVKEKNFIIAYAVFEQLFYFVETELDVFCFAVARVNHNFVLRFWKPVPLCQL